MNPSRERARSGKTATLNTLVRRLTRPLFGKRGFADGRVVADWAEIVGPLLARSCLPLRIAYPQGARTDGTLHLKVAPGGLATEIQHVEPILIERINGHFGYRAVARLRLVQGPLPPCPPAPEPPAPLDAEAEARLRRALEGVGDPALRTRLESLGRSVLAPRPSTAKTPGKG
ncbi:MAG: DciA family protein [Pseudomonadota bacterium]